MLVSRLPQPSRYLEQTEYAADEQERRVFDLQSTDFGRAVYVI